MNAGAGTGSSVVSNTSNGGGGEFVREVEGSLVKKLGLNDVGTKFVIGPGADVGNGLRSEVAKVSNPSAQHLIIG